MKKSEFDKLPVDLQNKYKRVIDISEDLWAWLCDNPTKNKTQYKKYKFISNTSCLLCDFHFDKRIKYTDCQECLLYYTCRNTIAVNKKRFTFGNWYQNIKLPNPDEQVSFDNAFKIWEILFDEKLKLM